MTIIAQFEEWQILLSHIEIKVLMHHLVVIDITKS